VHGIGDQPRLYYDARSSNHQDLQIMKFLLSSFLQSPVTSSLWGPRHPVLEDLQPAFYGGSKKSKRMPSIFNDGSTGSFIRLRRHIYMSHIIFMRIGFTLLTCDMYMCHLRYINDPVLSSLKMEGISFFLSVIVFYITSYTHNYFFPWSTFPYCILSTYIIRQTLH
jgi:hypothetical protein